MVEAFSQCSILKQILNKIQLLYIFKEDINYGKKNNVDDMNLQIDNVDFWQGGMRISWSGNIGFGTLDIEKLDGEELVLNADTECMDYENDKTFTQKILNLFLKKLKIVG